MWHSYFWGLQRKYSMRVSKKEPLVIRLDGKAVTRNKSINLLDEYKDSFYSVMKNSAWYFSKKYECYCIFGSDEISFVIPNPMILLNDLDDEGGNFSNELISLFSQYFFDYFNSLYKGNKIFWHAKCFTIPAGKISSYVKHRSQIAENVLSTYFLIKNNSYEPNLKLEENLSKCSKIASYAAIKDRIKGELYYLGNKIDLNEFTENGNVVICENEMKCYDINTDLDDDFEIEI